MTCCLPTLLCLIWTGLPLLTKALEVDPYLVGIIITGRGSIETAVDAMKSGAFDFILKPLDLEILKRSVSRAMEVRRLREGREKIPLNL